MIYIERAGSPGTQTHFRIWEVDEDGNRIRLLLPDGTWQDATPMMPGQRVMAPSWELWRLQL
jgi:hypothetical protein